MNKLYKIALIIYKIIKYVLIAIVSVFLFVLLVGLEAGKPRKHI